MQAEGQWVDETPDVDESSRSEQMYPVTDFHPDFLPAGNLAMMVPPRWVVDQLLTLNLWRDIPVSKWRYVMLRHIPDPSQVYSVAEAESVPIAGQFTNEFTVADNEQVMLFPLEGHMAYERDEAALPAYLPGTPEFDPFIKLVDDVWDASLSWRMYSLPQTLILYLWDIEKGYPVRHKTITLPLWGSGIDFTGVTN